jgi:hypothetical protein
MLIENLLLFSNNSQLSEADFKQNKIRGGSRETEVRELTVTP